MYFYISIDGDRGIVIAENIRHAHNMLIAQGKWYFVLEEVGDDFGVYPLTE